MRTLVVEDEKHLNRMISEAIQDEGYSVDSCFNGLEALELCACAAYDVIVLDIMMPKMDGFELVRRLRERGCKAPVVYLTSRDSVSDKVRGLEAGGDYYMVKPFEMLELLVRIEKVLERTGRARKVLMIRNIMVDVQSHQVLKDGIPVNLKPMEYDLFVLLLQNKNIALGREELLKRVWGEDYLGECDTFAGGKKSAHSVGLLNHNQSVNW